MKFTINKLVYQIFKAINNINSEFLPLDFKKNKQLLFLYFILIIS